MEHQQNGFSRFMKILKDYWFLIVFLGVLIFTWGQILLKVNYQGENIKELKENQTAIVKDIGEIKTNVAEIKGLFNKWDGYKK